MRILRFMLFAASSLYLLFLAASQHKMRASMIPVWETADSAFFERAPEDLPEEMRFEEYALLDRYRNDLPDSLRSADLPTMILIMQWLGERNAGASIRGVIPESPRVARSFLVDYGIRGSCYNDAILFSTYAQSVGARARVLAFDAGDGMGGSGHNVTEIWSEEHHKWVMFDAQQCAIFINTATSVPASAIEVRYASLAGPEYFSRHMSIHQAAGFVVNQDYIGDFYYRSRDFNILANSNFHTEIETSGIRQVAEWIELQGETLGKPALWAGRLVRSAFGTPFIRFRYLDRHTPDYAFDAWYVAYRIVIPVWLISALSIVVSILRKRSRFGDVRYWMRTGVHRVDTNGRPISAALEPLPPRPPQVPPGHSHPRVPQ